MAERSQYQYQPVTGPVWRAPVAEALAWLPQGQQPARSLPPNRLGDFSRPEFAALYKPEGLQWLPADRYAGRSLAYSVQRVFVLDPFPPTPRLLEWQPRDRYAGQRLPQILRGDLVQPPFDSLYKPEGLQWQATDRYTVRSLPRALVDWSIYPIQVIAPVYDPQNLEWIPSGRQPQVPIERRILGDFQQPPFEALYKPERLEWVLQGQQPARTIPFVWQGSWVIDPTTPTPVVFDPQLFPFQATDLVLSRVLSVGLLGDFSTPPLPPGPDVIPPVDAGGGGSNARHPRRVRYEKPDKRKPKTFIDRIGEPFVELETSPEPVPDAAAAGAVVADISQVRSALAARLPAPPLPSVTPVVRAAPPEDEDDDLLLLS